MVPPPSHPLPPLPPPLLQPLPPPLPQPLLPPLTSQHHQGLNNGANNNQNINNHVTPESIEDIPPPKADFSAPPPYEPSITIDADDDILTSNQLTAHSKLPTYEEVQMEKSLNGELFVNNRYNNLHHSHHQQPPPPAPGLNPHIQTRTQGTGTTQQPSLTFIAIDASDPETLTSDNGLLGTDIMFITAFMVAFLFNWIGFLMLTCFCHTIAARYGALSGFGLSLAKWTLIVKHSTDLASHENSWLWWLIMAFGFLICVRALVQYISIKRTWRLLSASAQERLVFFY